MNYLGYSEKELTEFDGTWTAREIEQQPSSWLRAQDNLLKNSDRIKQFLEPILAMKDCRIILTGAGTSAFVGSCVAPWLSQKLGRTVEAIATTDLVSAPSQYLHRDTPTLLVSFARSGNSPESVATCELAESMVDRCYQLVLSCNPEGSLYRSFSSGDNSLALLMPEETNDRAFAMTSSFTSMLLSIISIFSGIGAFSEKVERLSDVVARLIAQRNEEIKKLAGEDYGRVVYLGSNGLKGLAQEASLKLLELTDGEVIALFDSPLGFRHGPKSVVNPDSLVVILMSSDEYTRKYDIDILNEMVGDGRVKKVLALTPEMPNSRLEQDFFSIDDLEGCTDMELLFPYIVFAQMYGFHRAVSIGNRPDNPSSSGTVNRVVKGVTIHAHPV